jgi:hypothetical protein
MYAVHGEADGWILMAHGAAFLQYLNDSGDRGSTQTGSINWIMGSAARPIGSGGQFLLRGMASAEPWSIRGCGYPDLLATGEVCEGEAIHDRQHPHDLFMELAAAYDGPIAGGTRVQIYGAAVGEPALGPPAFPHRISAMANPVAPITHHWFDATHITFGVVTLGVHSTRWKAEASVFNGREPDEHRADFDFAALDSQSIRAWWLPSDRWAIQASAGWLADAEPGHHDDSRVAVTRVTASATYHRMPASGRIWATTVGWGRNDEEGSKITHAVMAETSLTRSLNTWFGRFEIAQKNGHDLAVESDDSFVVSKLQGGYTRYFSPWHNLQSGIGAVVSMGIVPDSLESAYGGRVNAGVGVFVTVRPAERSM